MKTLDKKIQSKLPAAIALRSEVAKIEERKSQLENLKRFQAAAQKDLEFALAKAEPDDPSSLAVISSVRTKIEVLRHRLTEIQKEFESIVPGLMPAAENLHGVLAETGRQEIEANKAEIRRILAPYVVPQDWERGLDAQVWIHAYVAKEAQIGVPPPILASDRAHPGFGESVLAWAHELLRRADKYETQGSTWAPSGWNAN